MDCISLNHMSCSCIAGIGQFLMWHIACVHLCVYVCLCMCVFVHLGVVIRGVVISVEKIGRAHV